MDPPTDSQAARTTPAYSTLPEAIPHQHQNTSTSAEPRPAEQERQEDHGLPEVVPGEYGYGDRLPQQRMLETGGGLNLPQKYEGSDPKTTGEPQALPEPSRQPWWKRRLFIIILALAIVIAILALAIGLGVGLTRRNAAGSSGDAQSSSSPSQTSSTSTGQFGTPTSFAASVTSQPSACRGTVCPSMLAVAETGTSGSDAKFFLFGRGTDQSIWYRKGGFSSWETDWTSLGGIFNSQPVAVSSSGGQRIDVLGTWTDGSVRSKTYQTTGSGGSWTNEWLNLGGNSINAPAACSPGGNSFGVFGTTADHLFMYRAFDGNTWTPALNENWTSFGGYTSASIAAACGTKTGYADIASYGGYAGSLHNVGFMHQTSSVWQLWEDSSTPAGGVGYIGDPALVAVPGSINRTEFFGIGSDARMYTIAPASNHSTAKDLGGSFESTPFILVSEGGSRLDVLAVGQDDRLKHQARLGTTWAGEWEDLGGYFGGVPLAIASPQGWVAVFGIGPKGHVIHGNWTPSADEPNWGEGSWFDDGKEVSTGWLRAGPAK